MPGSDGDSTLDGYAVGAGLAKSACATQRADKKQPASGAIPIGTDGVCDDVRLDQANTGTFAIVARQLLVKWPTRG